MNMDDMWEGIGQKINLDASLNTTWKDNLKISHKMEICNLEKKEEIHVMYSNERHHRAQYEVTVT